MEELVKRAKNNDEEAFDEIILSIEKEMYLIAKARLNSDDDIADAMQEAILSCYKNIHKLRDNSLFKSWAIRILINKCNDIYKRRKRNIVSIEKDNIEIEDKTNDESNLSFYILIRSLNEEEKTILTLYYYFKYTTKEISKILKINENTIKSKIIRAKNKLKKEYGGEEA